MTKQHWRLKLKRLAFACLGVCVLFFGIEASLRFGLGLGNPILIVPDRACGYMLKPEQDVYRFRLHTHINHFGMRSNEVGSKDGALRVLFLGDSITYGTTQVDQQDIFTDILRRELPADVGRPVQVLNASAGGWAISNEEEFVRSRGIFAADLVVLVLNSGDLTQRFATTSDIGDALPLNKPSSALEEVYSRYIKPECRNIFFHTDAASKLRRDDIVSQNIASLDALVQLIKQQGATLALVFTPFREEIPAQAVGSEPIEIVNWAQANGIPSLDVTPALSKYPTTDVTLDGMHLNSKGNYIVAESIRHHWREICGFCR